MNETFITNQPIFVVTERSDWTCYLFGATENEGIRYTPALGMEPNWFVRWMMKICFDCTWVKKETK